MNLGQSLRFQHGDLFGNHYFFLKLQAGVLGAVRMRQTRAGARILHGRLTARLGARRCPPARSILRYFAHLRAAAMRARYGTTAIARRSRCRSHQARSVRQNAQSREKGSNPEQQAAPKKAVSGAGRGAGVHDRSLPSAQKKTYGAGRQSKM